MFFVFSWIQPGVLKVYKKATLKLFLACSWILDKETDLRSYEIALIKKSTSVIGDSQNLICAISFSIVKNLSIN